MFSFETMVLSTNAAKLPYSLLLNICPSNILIIFSSILSACALTQESTSSNYEDFMRPLVGPVESKQLEYLFDFTNHSDVLNEYTNFDPKILMHNLMRAATDLSVLPNQFLDEVHEMLWDAEESEFNPFELTGLEKKYTISLTVEGPESITRSRLRLMFPHLAKIQQKPFCESEYEWSTFSPNSNTTIPTLFRHEDFGGLIPQTGALDKDVRKAIIAVHLYSLMSRVKERSGRFLCRLLKERIEKSMLSDERRILVLQNNDVLTKRKQLRSEIMRAFDEVPRRFTDDICWDILN